MLRQVLDLTEMAQAMTRGWEAEDAIVSADRAIGVVQRTRHRREQDLVDERALAAPADPGDADKRSQGEAGVDILQVVHPGTADADHVHGRGAGLGRLAVSLLI